MADIKYSQVRKLAEMGRELIDLPAEIWFDGNEKRQRTPGLHHLPQYRETGTYWHVNCCKQRLRVAEDRLNRVERGVASAYEVGIVGDLDTQREKIKKLKKDLLIVLAGGNPEEDSLSDVIEEKDEEVEEEVVEEDEKEEEVVEPKVEKIVPKKKATKKKVAKKSK